MSEGTPKVVVSDDARLPIDELRELTEGPFVKIESAEQLHAIARAAQERFAGAMLVAAGVMSGTVAARVRVLRCELGESWRGVAARLHAELGAADRPEWDWSPPSNQLFGMAFCEAAAGHLLEDHNAPPWN